jgi:hypothetical protein
MILHSEVAEIEMRGFTGRETGTGTEKEIEIVIETETETETVIVSGTETEEKTAGTRTEVRISKFFGVYVLDCIMQFYFCIAKSS